MPRDLIRSAIALYCLALCSVAGAAETLKDDLLSARHDDPAYASAQPQYQAAEQRVGQARTTAWLYDIKLHILPGAWTENDLRAF